MQERETFALSSLVQARVKAAAGRKQNPAAGSRCVETCHAKHERSVSLEAVRKPTQYRRIGAERPTRTTYARTSEGWLKFVRVWVKEDTTREDIGERIRRHVRSSCRREGEGSAHRPAAVTSNPPTWGPRQQKILTRRFFLPKYRDFPALNGTKTAQYVGKNGPPLNITVWLN